MKIRVADLPSEPVVLTHAWPASWVGEALGDRMDFRPVSPCEVRVEVTLVDETLICRGEIACYVAGSCSRCLADVEIELGGPLDLLLEPRRTPFDRDEDDDDAEDVGLAFYDGRTADLEPHVRELLALGIPMQAVCREDCRGLCPRCGKNLNEGPCGCASD